MCYDVTSGLKALIKYAKHRADEPKYIASLERQLEKWLTQMHQHFHVSGFAHPQLMVFTNEQPYEVQFFTWGLIPNWTKDLMQAKQLAKQTLNARIETMFDKPAFRNSAKHKRCLIYIDSFFEHHHFKGKTFPYLIASRDNNPLAIAGLWDEWVDQTSGEIFKTVSIVTCKANVMMQKIHNNPKLEEPRMPLILKKEDQDKWLKPLKTEEDFKEILKLNQPYSDQLLLSHTVKRLKGKDAIGNNSEVLKAYTYQELDEPMQLF